MLALSDTAEHVLTEQAVTHLDVEVEVLLACQAGDWSRYGWLVERYQRLVWAAVAAVVEDPSAVEDVVQEVFVRVYEKLHTFRYRSSFSSWLWRLARNHALSQRRRVQRRPRVERTGTPSGSSLEQHIAPAALSPHSQYEDGARELAIRDLLAALPAQYRELLHLHYLDERSYEDIAELTGIPLNTVRTRLRRGRQRLAELARAAGWS